MALLTVDDPNNSHKVIGICLIFSGDANVRDGLGNCKIHSHVFQKALSVSRDEGSNSCIQQVKNKRKNLL